jgi:hypothetical protein
VPYVLFAAEKAMASHEEAQKAQNVDLYRQ